MEIMKGFLEEKSVMNTERKEPKGKVTPSIRKRVK
jgi:hypothetical protein